MQGHHAQHAGSRKLQTGEDLMKAKDKNLLHHLFFYCHISVGYEAAVNFYKSSKKVAVSWPSCLPLKPFFFYQLSGAGFPALSFRSFRTFFPIVINFHNKFCDLDKDLKIISESPSMMRS